MFKIYTRNWPLKTHVLPKFKQEYENLKCKVYVYSLKKMNKLALIISWLYNNHK